MAGTLIFVHIPKAAGTTLDDVIGRQYPAGSVYKISGREQTAALEAFKGLPQGDRERIQVFTGHIGYGLHEYLRPPARYITIVRNPLSRVVSHYHWIRLRLDSGATYHDRPWLREAGRMSLLEYVRHGKSNDVRNGQTRMLAGVYNGWDAEHVGSPDPVDMLDEAKANVRDGMCLAGLSERFDETVLLLQRRMGWGRPFYVSRNINSSAPKNKESLDDETRAAIEETNQLDIELYRYITQLFDEAVAAEGATWERDLERFRFLNRRWRQWCRVRNAARHRTSVVLDRARPSRGG